MSEPPSVPDPGWRAVVRGLRRQVLAGTLSRWRAFGTAGLLVLAWLVLVGFVAVMCYVAALVAVAVARGRLGGDVRPDDPVVGLVAVSLCVATVVGGTVGTVRHRRRAARHRAVMLCWADAHGWAYAAHSSVLSSRWSAPGVRHGAWATDVLTRSTPRGEVTSTTLQPGAGERRASRHAVMVVGARWFPTLTMTPMTVVDRAERALGGQDIAVESYDINERWRIRCADARFAHEVLHPRLLERIDRAAVPGLCFLVQGRDVVVHAPGPTVLASIDTLVDLVLDLVSLLPAYLPDDYPSLSLDVPRRERRRSPRRVGSRPEADECVSNPTASSTAFRPGRRRTNRQSLRLRRREGL